MSRNRQPAGFHIFLSYRRADAPGYAGRLHDHLVSGVGDQAGFTPKQIFMDIDTLRPGRDFRQAIREAVEKCDVLLAVIGQQWTTVKDRQGRRIDNAADWVRLEIEAALERDIPVIPVLVHGAEVPAKEDLPDSLGDLVYRHAVELHHGSFRDDVGRLLRSLKQEESAKAKVSTPRTRRTTQQQGGAAKPKAKTSSTATPSKRKTGGTAKPKAATSSRGTAKRKAATSSTAKPSKPKRARKTESAPKQSRPQRQPSRPTGTAHNIFSPGLGAKAGMTELLGAARVGDVYYGLIETLEGEWANLWAKVRIGIKPGAYGKLPGERVSHFEGLKVTYKLRTSRGDLVGPGDVIAVRIESVNFFSLGRSDAEKIVLSHLGMMPPMTAVGPKP